MELRIYTKNSDAMDFFRRFTFENKDDFVVDEEYEHAEGYNKEPTVVAIIIALGTAGVFKSTVKMFEAYMKYKTEVHKIDANLLRLRIKTRSAAIDLSEEDACIPEKMEAILAKYCQDKIE